MKAFQMRGDVGTVLVIASDAAAAKVAYETAHPESREAVLIDQPVSNIVIAGAAVDDRVAEAARLQAQALEALSDENEKLQAENARLAEELKSHLATAHEQLQAELGKLKTELEAAKKGGRGKDAKADPKPETPAAS
jgi:ABC-type phosphate transport system auxiliary subunit